jgi:tetratricopeptide (TPR) repeat protein
MSVPDARLSVMNVGMFLIAASASFVPVSACQLSPADTEIYRRAVSRDLPFFERRAAYERSIGACPGDPRLYAEFAALLVADRDFSTALHWIDEGLVLAPEDAALNLRKGEVLVALGQAKDALAALGKTPATGESQFFRGTAYQVLEDHRAAQECFLDSWKRGNDDPYVLYSLVREDRAIGDKAAGLEHFQLMMTRFPDSVWVHVLVGDAYFKAAKDAEARQEYLAAVKLAPDLFEANFRLAYMAFEAGEFASATQYYQRALAVKPHHTEANVYLGEALRRERRVSEAIEQLRRAIQLDPKAALAYDSLSKALSDAGRLPEAVATLRLAEKQFPEDSSFPAMRARLLKRMGRIEDAEQAARRTSEILEERRKKEGLVNSK